ncbi:DUF3577 domain-containing protein [Dasania marina]|uniref:DUF3577 domain-containing protein n=1 Tax=Dasania marina TaxID=471499 RepID=UPI0030DD0DF4|tara:strand:+ start:15255 stop:15728 length:474 start_codon:yes stop_codon:yes gene_type:complete
MSKPTENIDKTSATADNNRYFNEYANGIGYLNSIREFGAEGKPERYAVQVSVIQGPADNVHYEYHDLIISSETVLGVVLEHRESIEAEEAIVLIRFNMANPRAKAFIYKHGDRAGELGAAIGGFLTRIHSMKINGELVYEDQRTFDDQEESPQAVNG